MLVFRSLVSSLFAELQEREYKYADVRRLAQSLTGPVSICPGVGDI